MWNIIIWCGDSRGKGHIMKKHTILGLTLAAAGAAGWCWAAGNRRRSVERIRRECKRLLAVRKDELEALRRAAESGELAADHLGPVPLDGAALESLRLEDGAAVLAVQRAAEPAGRARRALAGKRPSRGALHRVSGERLVRRLCLPGVALTCCASKRPLWWRDGTTKIPSPSWWIPSLWRPPVSVSSKTGSG